MTYSAGGLIQAVDYNGFANDTGGANANGVWDSANLGGSGKEGSFNALGNWSIGNSTVNWPAVPADPRTDSLQSFTYVGHAADGTTANYGTFGTSAIGGDGVADGRLPDHHLGGVGEQGRIENAHPTAPPHPHETTARQSDNYE